MLNTIKKYSALLFAFVAKAVSADGGQNWAQAVANACHGENSNVKACEATTGFVMFGTSALILTGFVCYCTTRKSRSYHSENENLPSCTSSADSANLKKSF